MFRQTFTASSRALRSAAPKITANQPLLRPQLRAAAPVYTIRAAQPSVSRWYSDAKEEKPAEEAKTESKEGNGEADAVAELKKSLEAKETEVKEWKVSILMPYSSAHTELRHSS